MTQAIRASDLRLACLDGLIAFASMAVSFILRFDLGPALHAFVPQLLAAAAIAFFLKPGIFLIAGLYAIYWRYVSSREVLRLFRAVAAASFALVLGAVLLAPFRLLRGIPAAILGVDFFVTTLAIASVRFLLYLRLSGPAQPDRPA